MTTSPRDLETYASRIELIFPRPTAEVPDAVADLLVRIATGCTQAGASLIGHLKCYGELPSGGYLHCHLTSLRAGASCEGTATEASDRIRLDLNVLVYGLARAAIAAEVGLALRSLSQDRGLRFALGADVDTGNANGAG